MVTGGLVSEEQVSGELVNAGQVSGGIVSQWLVSGRFISRYMLRWGIVSGWLVSGGFICLFDNGKVESKRKLQNSWKLGECKGWAYK